MLVGAAAADVAEATLVTKVDGTAEAETAAVLETAAVVGTEIAEVATLVALVVGAEPVAALLYNAGPGIVYERDW